LFEGLPEHNPCEMRRQPLEASVLQLRAMLPAGGSIRELLREALEPPDEAPLARALVSLANAGVLAMSDGPEHAHAANRVATLADAAALDTAALTPTGRLAAALPIDYTLTRLVCTGVGLGVAAEALVLAAGLSLGRSVFRVVSPLVIEYARHTWRDLT
jgi:HrpA-like RNA helicase